MHTNKPIDIFSSLDINTSSALERISTVDCPRCHWRQPVPVEFVDWKAIAEVYRNAYDSLGRGFMEKIKEMGEQFDAPLLEYLEADKRTMLAQLEALIKRHE